MAFQHHTTEGHLLLREFSLSSKPKWKHPKPLNTWSCHFHLSAWVGWLPSHSLIALGTLLTGSVVSLEVCTAQVTTSCALCFHSWLPEQHRWLTQSGWGTWRRESRVLKTSDLTPQQGMR
jgi:hypothetical protein